jgi:hypothetical protein
VIVTNGKSGYRYAALAEAFYGMSLANNSEGRANLAEIRKQEARSAGRILGLRHQYFLDQRDLGFEGDAAAAESGNWDRHHVRDFLSGILERERYDAVFTMLPTGETHGHHRAATVLALDAVSRLDGQRPLVFGVEARSENEATPPFAGLPGEPATRTVLATPAAVFDRQAAFGYRGALNYHVVGNWLIAEHKSQGLFQNDYGRHRYEQFWLFAVSGESALRQLSEFQTMFYPSDGQTTARKGASK